jgi:hypothetical protein
MHIVISKTLSKTDKQLLASDQLEKSYRGRPSR